MQHPNGQILIGAAFFVVDNSEIFQNQSQRLCWAFVSISECLIRSKCAKSVPMCVFLCVFSEEYSVNKLYCAMKSACGKLQMTNAKKKPDLQFHCERRNVSSQSSITLHWAWDSFVRVNTMPISNKSGLVAMRWRCATKRPNKISFTKWNWNKIPNTLWHLVAIGCSFFSRLYSLHYCCTFLLLNFAYSDWFHFFFINQHANRVCLNCKKRLCLIH